jgi:hypothetical protein
MKQQSKITSLQRLLNFIEDSGNFRILDKDENSFIIEAPNNATWQIQFEADNDISEIIYKTIDQLADFDADEKFTEYWNENFAKHNSFRPFQFITILKEDEESFRELADKLRKFSGKNKY